jgi:hypothetical protein
MGFVNKYRMSKTSPGAAIRRLAKNLSQPNKKIRCPHKPSRS